QDDVVARDARRNQLLRHGTRCTVVLYPDLAVNDVDVDDRAVYATNPVPAHVHHLVVIPVAVHNGLGFDLTVGWFVTCILADPPSRPFRAKSSPLGTEVAEQVFAAVGQGQGVVGDGPTLARQGMYDGIVMEVLGRHSQYRSDELASLDS